MDVLDWPLDRRPTFFDIPSVFIAMSFAALD